MTASTARSARVYLDGRPVGVLATSGDALNSVSFTYDAALRDDPTAQVSLRLPVRAAPYPERDALPCFENLLPDGDLRGLLAADVHQHQSDVVGLLGVFGGECAGALSLWPEGMEPPTVPTYRECTSEDVRAAFAPVALVTSAWQPRSTTSHLVTDARALAAGTSGGDARPDTAGGQVGQHLAAVLRQARMSMSGAQEKLVLLREPPTDTSGAATALYRLPVAGAPSTVLVKRGRGTYPGLVQNEVASMALMAAVGVETATHTVCALDREVYETTRFDRVWRPGGGVTRLHAEDGCQLTGRRPQSKYAGGGGPTYAELVTILRKHSANPLADTETLFRWAVANLALGNRDAHAKNLSLLSRTPTERRLAPAYDVVCTMAYAALDDGLALRFGGQVKLDALRPDALPKAAREFGLTAAFARELVADVCDRLTAARLDALQLAATQAGEHPVLGAMDVVVHALTALTRAKLLGA